MILKETVLSITDRSGISKAKVFHLYGGFLRKFSKIGLYVKQSNKKVRKKKYKDKSYTRRKYVFKGQISRSIVVQQVFNINRIGTSIINFKNNKSIITKRRKIILCKEVYGPGLRDIKRKKIILLFKTKF